MDTQEAPRPVGIFFFRPSLGGGTTTFTAHLFKALQAVGYDPVIYRVKHRGEEKLRPFGQYKDVYYQNIDRLQALRIVRDMPTVMGSPAAAKYLVDPDIIFDLMRKGMRVVIHDPNEFKIYDHLSSKKARVVSRLPTIPICIRPTMQRYYPEAVWIPHPYERVFLEPPGLHVRQNAVSVARIASVKRPKIILEANRLLPKELRVELKGAEYRMYTRTLEQKFGDVFKQSGKTFQFPMTFEAPVDICANYRYNVDMTWFPDDGGGTQYAQMEAWDAGCVNIMHVDWFRYGGEVKIGKHVVAVGGPKVLAEVLRDTTSEWGDYQRAGYNLLKKHAPKLIGEMYMREMEK